MSWLLFKQKRRKGQDLIVKYFQQKLSYFLLIIIILYTYSINIAIDIRELNLHHTPGLAAQDQTEIVDTLTSDMCPL